MKNVITYSLLLTLLTFNVAIADIFGFVKSVQNILDKGEKGVDIVNEVDKIINPDQPRNEKDYGNVLNDAEKHVNNGQDKIDQFNQIKNIFFPERPNETDYERTIREARFKYVSLLAGIGAIAGQIHSKDSKGTVTGAVVGGLLGLIYGDSKGKKAAEEKRKLANNVKSIKKTINHAKKVNQATTNLNLKLADDIIRIRSYNKSSSREKKAYAYKKYQESKKNLKVANEELEALKEFSSLSSKRSQVYKLDQQISTLQREVDLLSSKTTELATINKRIIL
ncbi:secreted protein [Candidatus Magnetomorum sp. HK-1]|nr:secreted protein [Candidatus Magnetomorum sp. HK-1]